MLQSIFNSSKVSNNIEEGKGGRGKELEEGLCRHQFLRKIKKEL